MSRFITIVFVAGMLLVCGPVAHAQFDSGPRYDAHSVSALVDRVHTDLDRAYGVWHFSKDDRERLNHAEKELREFAQTWDKGKFDVGRLDDAIGSIQHVLDTNKLPQSDRAALSDDVTQLHRMREAYKNHEIGT
jgi:hypothetical protein